MLYIFTHRDMHKHDRVIHNGQQERAGTGYSRRSHLFLTWKRNRKTRNAINRAFTVGKKRCRKKTWAFQSIFLRHFKSRKSILPHDRPNERTMMMMRVVLSRQRKKKNNNKMVAAATSDGIGRWWGEKKNSWQQHMEMISFLSVYKIT